MAVCLHETTVDKVNFFKSSRLCTVVSDFLLDQAKLKANVFAMSTLIHHTARSFELASSLVSNDLILVYIGAMPCK
jgi:hypothetical protein